MIYLDYAANCPVDERVLKDFNEKTIKYYANPNSSHKLGLESKKIIDDVTSFIKKTFNLKESEIIYTSGATEANNLVIKGFAEKYTKGHIITTSIEHSSIIAPCNYLIQNSYDVDIIEVGKNGKVNIEDLKKLIDNKETLISITSVESETGIIQDIEEIANFLKDYENVYFHTDMTQAIGKIKIKMNNIDFITFAPHKFYGIPGVGVLIKKENVKIIPEILGGKSTTIYRSGTPSLGLIASVKAALELALKNQKENNSYLKELNEYIRKNLSNNDEIIINTKGKYIYNTINISLKNKSSEKIVKSLEENEIYVSTKSACSSKENMSKVIYSITKNENLAKNTIRISISHLTTKEEIDKFLSIFNKILEN